MDEPASENPAADEPVQSEAEEAAPVDIHKPKAIHSWREFLVEIGTIVIGVLIALAGEQAVEAWHWRNEVADTREALNSELATNLGAVQHRVEDAACINRRLDQLGVYFKLHAKGVDRPPSGPIGAPQFRRPRANVWEIAKTGQVAGHLPLKERLEYAALYDQLDWLRDRMLDESVEWTRLSELDDYDTLEPADWTALRQARARAKALALKVGANAPLILERGKAMLHGPIESGRAYQAERDTLCRPIG